MQVTETLSDGLLRGFTVVLPATDIETRRAERLDNLSKALRLPGFRPGKVPMGIVKQRYGTAVAAEVLEESVNEAARQVVSDRGLRPALQPKVEIVTEDPTAAAARDIEFHLNIEILPEITLPDFATLALTRLKAEVSAEQLAAGLTMIARARRKVLDLSEEEMAARGDDGGARDGDVLVADYIGRVNGEVFEGGSATDANIDIGGDGFIPGFVEQLAGIKPGETRMIDVTFPEAYSASELAGKPATFEITAKRLGKAETPALDDNLAMEVGYDTLDELREDMRARRQGEYDELARTRLKRQLLDALAAMVDFPIPPGILKTEFDQIWDRLVADREAGRLDEDDKGKDDETLRAEYGAIAERRVRLGLLLAEIGRVNNLTVTENELERAVRREAARHPGQEEMMLGLFRKYPQLTDNLRAPIFEDKIVDYILELARVTDQVVAVEELVKEPAAPAPAETA
jgi:trigger factor